MANLYKANNIAGFTVNAIATGLLFTASLIIGQPWMFVASTALVGGITALGVSSQKKLMENNLTRHADATEDSPHLGRIAKELYQASGLKVSEYPIYDFKPDEKKMDRETNILAKAFGSLFEDMAKTHNAAAMHLGKPVIMISKPLLKLLGDEEEKAVLAHEFAHAAARHNRASLWQGLASGFAVTTAWFAKVKEFFATGFIGIASSIGATIAATALYNYLAGKPKEGEPLTKKSIERANRFKMGQSIVGNVTAIGLLTYFNPVYLTVWAVTKAMGVGAKLLSGHLHHRMEFQADRGAVDLGGNPLALITALRKITAVMEKSQEKAFGGIPEKGFLTKAWESVTQSHPTLEKRIARLSAIARKKGYSETEITTARTQPIKVSNDQLLQPELLTSLMQRAV